MSGAPLGSLPWKSPPLALGLYFVWEGLFWGFLGWFWALVASCGLSWNLFWPHFGSLGAPWGLILALLGRLGSLFGPSWAKFAKKLDF